MIGFARDGYLIYGRHLQSTNDGYSTALDVCGGHSHGTYGYHYHSQLLNMTFPSTANGITAGTSYIAYLNGPYYCKIAFVLIYLKIIDLFIKVGEVILAAFTPTFGTTKLV